ncbi:hypothetical protein [uncultured Paraglaciecola sp.]|uniref:hypothetical protein n=1 Tax=uncultured Paraglaciecola sp. TaxID=1765024 RepID=UPI002615DD2E|nr:hypothetical protein [uncultured Paraglaciecola sp.]
MSSPTYDELSDLLTTYELLILCLIKQTGVESAIVTRDELDKFIESDRRYVVIDYSNDHVISINLADKQQAEAINDRESNTLQ